MVTVNGAARAIYVASVAITGRRIEAQLTFTGVDGPVDASLRQRLVAAVAARTARP
ncbi:MAG TPA: hypothetical protein VE442_13475 [Jatrophihabitans sp.]|nr:hypothetical protein [Jatrophihabitans sp.]